jgi:hypothetical protein
MNAVSHRADAGARDPAERLQSWAAALVTVLLHALLLLLATWSDPVPLTTPQGAAAGSALQVTWIDESLRPPPSARTPSVRTPASRALPKPAPAATRLQSTPVPEADDPVTRDVAAASDSATTSSTQDAGAPSSPPGVPDESARRRNPMWGRPPGMLPDGIARANAGPASTPTVERGRRNDAPSAQPTMEVGGYQVYYDLVSEIRLRAWRDQGMTELFLPLPGSRRLMVCPLEIVLYRNSGPCRLVEPDAPELAAIGDARDFVHMLRVYRLGEVVWRGPGPYR